MSVKQGHLCPPSLVHCIHHMRVCGGGQASPHPIPRGRRSRWTSRWRIWTTSGPISASGPPGHMRRL